MAQYTLWVYRSDGSLKTNDVWDQARIEHFVFVVNAGRSSSWREAFRADLRRFGPLFGSKSGWPTPPPAIPRHQRTAEPYERELEAAFTQAALAAQGPTRSRQLFVVAAGFGAGLDGRDLPRIKASDIVQIGTDRLGIAVRPDPWPVVPVREAYTDLLREAVELAGERPLLGADRPNATYNATSLVKVRGTGKVHAPRMRSTWIVRHLENETPFVYLARLSGLETPKRIVEPLRFVRESDVPTAHARALLA